MKPNFEHLLKAFESRIRLGIMSVLAINDSVDFTELKEYLDVTDGNLATHLKALEKEEFIQVNKQFVERKPRTSYKITSVGRTAFENHLKALESLIKMQNQ